MNEMFDYHALVRRVGMPPEELARLEECIRRQYGSDQMMFELRMLRTLEAIAQRAITLEQAIEQFRCDSVVERQGARELPAGYGS